MKTRPMGKVWGGVRIYRRSRWEQLHAALHEFTIAGAEDPKGAIIFADFFMYRNLGLYTVFFFYDGEKPPRLGRLQRCSSNPHVYEEIASEWRRRMRSGYLDQLRHFPSQCSIEFQPLPAAVGLHSERAGGNAMGLRASDPDRVVLNLQCMWRQACEDATVRALAAGMTAWLEERLPAWKAQAAGLGRRRRKRRRIIIKKLAVLLLLLLPPPPTCRCS
ncbi:hypothetical protein PG997_008245 [Apiospora hydei]|uniref:Uncharacterized protein n=1 Tax=Apiospora hydei TaxID=1337664 RepID=A0ABR1WAI0_9PEZI